MSTKLQKAPYEPENPDLDPNDPKVYTNPDKIRLLDQREQMIANVNRAKNGLMVGGDQVRTMEAILEGAGYRVTHDGQFSADELQALQDFKDKLEDKAFKETAITLLTTIACVATMDVLTHGRSPNPQNPAQKPAFDAIQTLASWMRPPAPAP